MFLCIFSDVSYIRAENVQKTQSASSGGFSGSYIPASFVVLFWYCLLEYQRLD